jgi:hypothetical protein
MTESVPTIVLSPRFHGDSQDMWRAAVTRGWDVHRAIRYRGPENADECFVYGEIMFADMMAERLDLGLLDPPNDWLANLSKSWTLRTIEFCTAETLPSFDTRHFVKPANDKVFQYGVYENARDVPLRYVDPKCPVLVSEVVAFDLEVRLYVLDGKILTSEYYRLVGDHEEQDVRDAANEFGAAVLERYGDQLPSAVVLDVGHIEEQGWAVVEANQAYASGIYGGADVNAVLDVCRRAAGQMSNVRESDRKFLRSRP